MHTENQVTTFIKESVLYRIGDAVFGVLRFTVNNVLHVIYGGKGKTVPPVRDPLLLKSATQLAEEIREGKTKSEDVVQAYIQRIQEVEPFINATVDRCFEDALEKAREVDSLLASGKYTRKQLAEEKPLLGLPISIKSLLMVKGLRCTGGCKYFEHQRADEDAPSVALMRKAGAIVIATTNVPEAAINLETLNNLHGMTRNPYGTNRTCGGSSGGEGALIAAGASVFGLGNDLLGSLRIPAHFNGIFSHKPSTGLVPNGGSFPPEMPSATPLIFDTEIMKCGVTGPMCRYAEDLVVGMRILSSERGAKLNFGQKVNFEKLKIVYLKEFYSPLAPLLKKR
ncbi:fatty-acid amide hydrolase 2-B [Caerostris darwini]|uniref:Fatty-acid amide hydrolase 2-B n=1 Tax=Caerostris darwini TaxID=1538125 RepID=A0AAV4TVT0_9ARAC|nr:fatty-acid amide hydrolase 2-B [Caerostris darwini]